VPQLSARATAIWRSRRASGSLSGLYMDLTTFTAKASCIAEDVGRVSGHAEHQASMRSRLPSGRVTSNAVVDGAWFISGAFPRSRPATTPARWVPVPRAGRALP
jgi:hypothetical protein